MNLEHPLGERVGLFRAGSFQPYRVANAIVGIFYQGVSFYEQGAMHHKYGNSHIKFHALETTIK